MKTLSFFRTLAILQKFIAKLAKMEPVEGKKGPFGPLTDLTKTD